MANKEFQYEIQPYQEDCINNIIDIFNALKQNQPFHDVMIEHNHSHKYNFPVLDTNNIDIMMETGTGKTFTFIKTMFELNRNFGYKKFIILIPTVPIREGTKNNLDDTKGYFKQYYANERDKEIDMYVYENGQIPSVKHFIGNEGLSVLIMTPSSFDKDKNKLNLPLEKDIYVPTLFENNSEPPKTYLECLKRLNPIIIMDEPHRFDGNAFKKYFNGFNNYYLRFGATFPKKKNANDTTIPLSNVAYILDSISSFRQNLVKKIVVYTQDIVQNRDSLVKVENKKAVVNTLNNGVIITRKLSVGELYNGKSIRKINASNIILSDDSIEKTDYNLSDDALRSMIKETIRIHFEKEKELFYQGIKALTLFFIGSDITLYRGNDPKIKNIFEEEYINQRKEIIEKYSGITDDAYYKYLQNDFDSDGNLQVDQGYFSGDKGSTDEKIKIGVDDILKNKKRLLSLKCPTRFIFSIWALQEGWDNPNVFTICKLSNQGSDISKLQQIGRGLRICVDQDLKRHTIKTFGDNQDEFWKVNNLDVVVSNQELGFVEAIQNEILSNSFIITDAFTEQDLIKTLKEKTNFDDNIIFSLFDTLTCQKMIIRKSIAGNGQVIYEKSPDYSSILKEQKLPDEQRQALEGLFASDYKNFVQDKNKIKPKKNIVIKEKHLEKFKELWDAINKNAFYMIDNIDKNSKEKLIDDIKADIEALNIDKILLQTIRKELNVNKIGEDGSIKTELKESVSYKSQIDYLQLIRDLSGKTKTPISFIVEIFNSLSSDFKNKIIANNPAQALKEMADIIRGRLVGIIKTKVHYNGIDSSILPKVPVPEPDVFLKNNGGETYLKAGTVGKYQKDIDKKFSLEEKWIFKDVIEYDSNFEVEIIEHDPDMNEIEIFGKLPRLKIQTPLGEYNPDFCYAVKGVNGNELFLIVESKGYDTSTDIPTDEKGKIDFAKKYFESLNDYYKNKKSNIRVSYKERINKTQLASLIK